MAFNDYRNNDLAKYRSSFVDYEAEDVIGRSDKLRPDNFYNMGSVSGTVILDLSTYKYFKLILAHDVTITGTHSKRPANYNEFFVEIDNITASRVTWDTWFEWSRSSTPNLTSSGTYLLTFEETNVVTTSGSITYTKCLGYLS